jgi:hypothetical protein
MMLANWQRNENGEVWYVLQRDDGQYLTGGTYAHHPDIKHARRFDSYESAFRHLEFNGWDTTHKIAEIPR